jgi:hypothetical protein
MLRLAQHGGNLCGNPGADIRHHRTTLDEMSPAPEQPDGSRRVQPEGFGPTRSRKVVCLMMSRGAGWRKPVGARKSTVGSELGVRRGRR